jgi:hypothetical protein
MKSAALSSDKKAPAPIRLATLAFYSISYFTQKNVVLIKAYTIKR